MSVYVFQPRINEYDSLDLVDPGLFEVLQRFKGASLREHWSPLAVKVLPPEGRRGRRATDFPSLGAATPVLSERAWTILEPILGASVEALPLLCADTGPLFILNVLDVVSDALDLDASELGRLDDGLIFWVRSYVLRRRAVEGHAMFKLAEIPLGEVLIAGEVRRAVERHGLVGLSFGDVTLIG